MQDQSFDLFGSNIDLKFYDKCENAEGNWVYGLTTPDRNIIAVSKLNRKDEPLREEEIEISRLHEIIHMILEKGQYLQSSMDEPMVEWIARCLYSLKKQNIL